MTSLISTLDIPEVDKHRLDWYRRQLGRGIGRRGELKALARKFPASLGGPLEWAPSTIVKNEAFKIEGYRGLYSLVRHLPDGEQKTTQELIKFVASRSSSQNDKATVPSVRRSVLLPAKLVDEACKLSPPELRDNFNRLVLTALREYVQAHGAAAFERAMQEMAADPQVQAECRAINHEFVQFDSDGLND